MQIKCTPAVILFFATVCIHLCVDVGAGCISEYRKNRSKELKNEKNEQKAQAELEEEEHVIDPSNTSHIQNLPPLFSRTHARDIIISDTHFMSEAEERNFLQELHMNTHWSPKKTNDI